MRPVSLGAVRGADPPSAPLLAKWPAGSWDFPSSSQLKPAPRIRWTSGVLRPGSWGSRASPSPRPRAASLPSPRPAHCPSPPVPGPSPPPLSLPPPQPQLPPTACSPVPVTLLGVYAGRPPRTPPRSLRAPQSPGPTAPQPRSSRWRRSRSGRCRTPGAASAGKKSTSPTQPGTDPRPLWPVAPSGPEGEEASGRGAWASGWPRVGSSAARAPVLPVGLAWGWAPQRARRTGPTGCWQKLCSTAQT